MTASNRSPHRDRARVGTLLGIAAVLFTLSIFARNAWSAGWTLVSEIEPKPGTGILHNSHIGTSVAMSGDGKWIFLGGYYSGAVVRWDGTNTHLREFPYFDPSSGSLFGWAGDCTENFTLVGAYGANGDRGAIHVYDTSDLSKPMVTIDDRDGHFGYSVAAVGNVAVVGAPDAEGGKGRAFVLRKDSGVWGVAQTLARKGEGLTERAAFGSSVSVDNESGIRYAAVSCPLCDGKDVYIYRFNKGAGEFKIDGIVDTEYSPGDVAISDLYVAVYHSQDATIRVYKRLGTTPAEGWSTTYKTISLGVPTGQHYNLAMSGNLLAIGMGDLGEARIYRRDSRGDWGLEKTIKHSAEGFGQSVAINPSLLVVGAPNVESDTVDGVGAAYLYQLK
jgi:hypothetical protein